MCGGASRDVHQRALAAAEHPWGHRPGDVVLAREVDIEDLAPLCGLKVLDPEVPRHAGVVHGKGDVGCRLDLLDSGCDRVVVGHVDGVRRAAGQPIGHVCDRVVDIETRHHVVRVVVGQPLDSRTPDAVRCARDEGRCGGAHSS